MKTQRHLVVFAKAPRLGAVKTRLASDIGAVAATGFYRRTLATVLRRLATDRRWTCHIAVTPDTALSVAPFWPSEYRPHRQGMGDLGDRMARPFLYLPPGPVVIIGTDVPDIQAHHIETAFKALGNHDAVFGPARDGGYWLVGARRSPATPDLFSNVPWSSPSTLADSLKNLDGKRVALLDTLDDIDDGAAYKNWLMGQL